MYNRSKILALAVLLCLLFIPISEFIASIHSTNNPTETNPKFVIAGWDYPDEYGQGINYISIYENSTGSWVLADTAHYYGANMFEWNASVGIYLGVATWFNSTLTGASDNVTGRNYFRHNVTVTQINGTVVFSQENFTYAVVNTFLDPPMWRYTYYVILNFLPEMGEIYTVTVDYEVFYLGGSGEYEASDQSITSFSETLPDDVLYYPDAIVNNTEMSATSGTGDYIDSIVLDSVYWETSVIEYANFTISGSVEGFTYHCYGKESDVSGSVLQYYNGTNWVTLETFTTSNAWYNDTVEGLYATNTVQLRANNIEVGDIEVQIDFLSISTVYMTLAENGYAESFSDVSDWTALTGVPMTSNGDLGIKTHTGDTAYYYEQTNDISITNGCYAEARFRTNVSGSTGFRVWVFTLDDGAGTNTRIFNIGALTTWQTAKIYVAQDIESVRIGWATNVASQLEIDYLRFYPANESGWQHDGSTVEGISSSDGGIITTDGDEITLTSDVDASSFIIPIDTTATAAYLATSYYPFLVVNCTYVSEGDGWKIEQYDGSAWAKLSSSVPVWYVEGVGIARYNMKPLDTYVEKFRLNLTQTATVKFSFMKACSIANWTYAGTGTSVDDVLYVSDGTLYCSATEITSMVLDHDPPLSIELPIGSTWEITTSSGVPQTDYYLEGAWVGYSSETEGIFANGTLTDVRIKFTDSANIAAIEFIYPLEDWGLISNPTLIFSVPYDYWALNMGLIFGGLILMLLSTCIVAKKVRDKNISKDAGMILLLLFCVGWGLFIGGAVIG